MGDPIFKLEGVVKTKDEAEDFEGPLSVILQLLSKNKIEIKDISISDILDQYLKYLEEMTAMDLEIASEFVAMASHLTYIKTKMLLATGDEEVSELEQLISSLEDLKRKDIYQRIKAVGPTLGMMYLEGSGYIVKPQEYLAPDKEYRYSHERTDILEAMMRVLSREDAAIIAREQKTVPMPTKIIYSVTSKLSEVVTKLRQFGVMRIEALFSASGSRSELVATFISVLELCKLGSIRIAGTDDDLTISYTGTGDETLASDFDVGAE